MLFENLKKEAIKLNKKEQVEFMHFMVDLLAEKNPINQEDWKAPTDLKKNDLDLRTSKSRRFDDISGI